MWKKIGVVIIVIAAIIVVYWWWGMRSKSAPPVSQAIPAQKVSASTKADSAQIIKGLKGVNLNDINKELQNINSGQ
jgi:hypothetical protein